MARVLKLPMQLLKLKMNPSLKVMIPATLRISLPPHQILGFKMILGMLFFNFSGGGGGGGGCLGCLSLSLYLEDRLLQIKVEFYDYTDVLFGFRGIGLQVAVFLPILTNIS